MSVNSKYDRLLISWMYRAGLASKSICQVHEIVTSVAANDGYVRNIISNLVAAGLQRDGTSYAQACEGYLRERYPDEQTPAIIFPSNVAYEHERIAKEDNTPARLGSLNKQLQALEIVEDGQRPEKTLRKLNRADADHLRIANEGIARSELIKAEIDECLKMLGTLRSKHQSNPEWIDRQVIKEAGSLVGDLIKLLHQCSDLDRRYVDMRRTAYGLDDPEAAVDSGVKIDRVVIHIHQTRDDQSADTVETPWEDAEFREEAPVE